MLTGHHIRLQMRYSKTKIALLSKCNTDVGNIYPYKWAIKNQDILQPQPTTALVLLEGFGVTARGNLSEVQLFLLSSFPLGLPTAIQVHRMASSIGLRSYCKLLLLNLKTNQPTSGDCLGILRNASL